MLRDSQFDWREYTPALVILILSAALIGAVFYERSQIGNQEHLAAAKTYSKTISKVPLGTSNVGSFSDAKTYRDEYHAKYNLKVQREAARWSMWSMWATWLGVGLLFFTLKQAADTNRHALLAAQQAQRQADLSEQAHKTVNRPWLDIDATAMDGAKILWREQAPNLNVPLDLVLTNHGSSPALNLRIAVELVYGLHWSFSAEVDRIASEKKHALSTPLKAAIYPSSNDTIELGFGTTVRESMNVFKLHGAGWVTQYKLIIVVFYDDMSLTDQYLTAQCVNVQLGSNESSQREFSLEKEVFWEKIIR